MANIVHERTRHFCIPRSGTTTYKDNVLKGSFSALSKLIFQVHTHFAACFEMCKMHLHIARFSNLLMNQSMMICSTGGCRNVVNLFVTL